MLEAGKDNNEANRQKILPIMRDLLDEYNDKYKNRALTSDLLQDVHEFPLYYGAHVGDDETPDAYNIRKVALPLAIPAGAAAWEGMCFLGGAIAGWFGWQQTKEYLKENNYVDDDENPIIMHGNGADRSLFTPLTEEEKRAMRSRGLEPSDPLPSLEGFTPPNPLPPLEGFTPSGPLPKLGGFDIYDGPNLNILETRKAKEAGDQVHHVIPQNDERYKKFWEKTGLNDQDEVNLLDLPGREKAIREKSKKAIHQGRHDKPYHDEVKEETDKFLKEGESNEWTQKEFRENGQKLLNDLKGRLNEGDLHVNRACERLHNQLKGKQ